MPIVGDGHYEMDIVKAYLEVVWPLWLMRLVQAMGWRSESALASAKRCADTHESFQLLMIFHFGTLLELIEMYV